MSHHIYTTPGFITHSAPHGEAGKFFLLFTRDLGMIGATAQGVRLSQSKLRYYTQDFSYSLFSIVKGKEVWRVVGAKEVHDGGEVAGENKKLYVKIISLLKRLLHGEEKNEKLFLVMESFHAFLLNNVLTKENSEMVECVTVLRILNSLGYISDKKHFQSLASSSVLSEEVIEEGQKSKDLMIKAINEGLKESQL